MKQTIQEPKDIFPIGTKYTIKTKKCTREYTVVDYLRTYNSAGELVRFRYVAIHNFMGQDVTDYDVCDTTIRRAKWNEK